MPVIHRLLPRFLAAVAAAAVLAGCAAQVTRGGGADDRVTLPPTASQRLVVSISATPATRQTAHWPDFAAEIRRAFETEARSVDMPIAFQEGPARPTGEAGTLLAFEVQDYRWLSTGARYGLGVMTGNAFVNARLQFQDLKSGASYGSRTVNTSSSAWQGVFSAMTDKQLQAIARDTLADLRRR